MFSGIYYIGSTDDLDKRLIRHNKGPFIIAYKEEFETRSEARKREYYLKSLKSKVAIEKLIQNAAFV